MYAAIFIYYATFLPIKTGLAVVLRFALISQCQKAAITLVFYIVFLATHL